MKKKTLPASAISLVLMLFTSFDDQISANILKEELRNSLRYFILGTVFGVTTHLVNKKCKYVFFIVNN